ncbi:hypothetical protein [Streptomyces sp. N35]|nr:hypothetical protein [Streptomyces sp. N35]
MLINYRSGLIADKGINVSSFKQYTNLTNCGYPDGGTWNDKGDACKISGR